MRPEILHRRLSWTALLAALVLFLGLSADAAAAGDSAVFTQDMLQNAGVTRISDVLLLIDDWALSTTDGYTWKASPNGLSTFEKQQWIVMFDGQRADLKILDVINLNLLPISVDQIDSVVVLNTPQLHEGLFADRGLIHFYTKTPRPGETYGASFMGGSETGDPGPYRYTGYETPNVDSDGPDASLGFGLARDGWYLNASVSAQLHFFTDADIRPRTADILGWRSVSPAPRRGPYRSEAAGFSRIFDFDADENRRVLRRISAAAGLGFKRGKSRHEPFFGYSRAQNYFHFFEPMGREIPADNSYVHAGITGVFFPADKLQFAYRLQYSTNRLSKRKNVLSFDYDWRATRYNTNAELVYQWPVVRGTAGATFEGTSVATEYYLTGEAWNVARVYAGLDISPSARAVYRLGGMLTVGDDVPSATVFWSTSIGLSGLHAFEAAFSFTQRPFAEEDDLWYWTSRGYKILADNGVDCTMGGEITNSNGAAADLTWQIGSGGAIAVGVTGSYRYYSDMYFEQRDFTLDVNNCVLSSPTDIVTGVQGQLLGGGINATYRIASCLRGSARYKIMEPVSGGGAFEDAWRTVPRHTASARIRCRPYGDFSFGAALEYRSAAYWKAYQNVSSSGCDLDPTVKPYSATIGDTAVLDVVARKLLLKGSLAADLICRNAWNEHNRYHPVGASLDLSFYLQLSYSRSSS